MSRPPRHRADGGGPPRIVFFYSDFESLGVESVSAAVRCAGMTAGLVYRNVRDYYSFDSGPGPGDSFFRRTAREICEQDPDVLGLSLLTDTLRVGLRLAGEVKRIRPRVRVLAGGVHASLLPERTLGHPQVDAVCLGEGESSAPEYLRCLDRIAGGESPGIPGILYRQGGRTVGDPRAYGRIRDLDSLPFADKELFYDCDPSLRSHYFLSGSRGCPFACSYCVNDSLGRGRAGRRIRFRSPERIVEELEQGRARHAYSYVVFLDECFGADPEHSERLLRLYRDRVRVPFLISTHPHLVNARLAGLLRDAGCGYVILGVQSLNEELSRQVLRRPVRRHRVSAAIRAIRSRGLPLQCDHMLGIPGETRQDMLDALRFYNEHRPSVVSVFWLTYYPKAWITAYARKQGILTDAEIEEIETGRRSGGIKRVQGWYAVNFWLNYLPFLPQGLARLLLRTPVWRAFRVRNPLLSSALPRALRAVLHRQDWNRYYLKRAVLKKLWRGGLPAARRAPRGGA